MSLSPNQLAHVCLKGGGEGECRYLSEGDDGNFYCLKLVAMRRKKIDEAVTWFEKTRTDHGLDPADEAVPQGDNCKGYLLLLDVLQGYDVP